MLRDVEWEEEEAEAEEEEEEEAAAPAEGGRGPVEHWERPDDPRSDQYWMVVVGT